MSNKLYLIGAGPGDPELLTLKAIKILNSVDLVMFDNLVDRRILDYIENPNIETVFSGKGVGESFKQKDINQNILEALKLGKNVARLKGGDPLIFARGRMALILKLSPVLQLLLVPLP
jgi:siroheme synthase